MLFIVVAVFAAVFAVRFVGIGWEKIEGAMETSSQLPVRISVVLVFALAYLASDLGLDLLLGGFVAGIITRLALKGREVTIFESKLSAVGYGFLIPFFFVVSGINFDMSALIDDPERAILVPIFFLLFLVVRGVPAMLLYRKRARPPRPGGAGLLQRDRAAARRRDHDDRRRRGSDAGDDVRGPGRGRGAVDGRLPAPRPADARLDAGPRGRLSGRRRRSAALRTWRWSAPAPRARAVAGHLRGERGEVLELVVEVGGERSEARDPLVVADQAEVDRRRRSS